MQSNQVALTRFLPDTSCLVAALSGWHEHHERTRREIERRLVEGQTLVLAAPAIVELFAVLTRLPRPHRLSPASARSILENNLLSSVAEVVALDAAAYLRLIQDAADRAIAGGALYDAVIMACARTADVDVLLTFNDRHFRLFAVPEIQIVVPP